MNSAATIGSGVFAAVVCVVASTRSWLELGAAAGLASGAVTQGLSEAPPLASSVSLVLLASWGALLVTRGRFRRAVALVAVVAALALVWIAVAYLSDAGQKARDDLGRLGVDRVDASLTLYFWATLIAALGSTLLAVLAVIRSPSWPEMSRRYDAPGDTDRGSKEPDLTSGIDVWKAMDEGHDPTTGPSA